jgi:hypothetical protein
MNTKEVLKVTGEMYIKVFNSEGELKEKIHVPNLVVTSGREWIASRITATPDTAMTSIALGSDNTTPVVSDLALTTELDRANITSQIAVNNITTYESTFAAGVGTGAITEAGIFNSTAASSGTMLCRTIFNVVNKSATDIMTISWSITIS